MLRSRLERLMPVLVNSKSRLDLDQQEHATFHQLFYAYSKIVVVVVVFSPSGGRA